MTETDFIQLVRRAERAIQANAGLYRLKLALFALLGYAVIFLILLLLASLLGGIAASVLVSGSIAILLLKKKLIIPVLFMIWVLLKSLWIRFEIPAGYELTRDRFPELFREIDALRKKLRSLPIHKVILTPELNAAVMQIPRLGVFGWQHNTLFLGLELLLLLSPAQARAVLGHEFGHLSKNHSRFSAWIYRIRATWARVMEAFQENNALGGKLLQRFFNWYAPNFSAYSFALARSNEYEADAVAANLTSGDTAAAALINTHVTGPYVGEFYWDAFFRQADSNAEPVHMPYTGLAGFMAGKHQFRGDIAARLEQQMTRKTAYDDTHPALAERIHALGTSPELPLPVSENTAAVAWLGRGYAQVMQDFDNDWYAQNRERWSERYHYVQDATGKLAELECRPQESLDRDAHWQLAVWTEEFRSAEAALPIFRAYQERFPQDLDAAYVIGRLLYAQHDDACLSKLEMAAASPALTVRACELAYFHLLNKGDADAAEAWRQRALDRLELEHRIEAERESVAVDATLLAADMPAAEAAELGKQLAATGLVKAAWLARKEVRYNPHDPVYVVAFKPRGFYWSHNDVIRRVASRLEVSGHLFVIVKGGEYRQLANRVVNAGRRIL